MVNAYCANGNILLLLLLNTINIIIVIIGISSTAATFCLIVYEMLAYLQLI